MLGAVRILIVALLALASTASASDPAFVAAMAEGNDYYARRAEGSDGPVGSPVVIEQAITAFRRASAIDPESAEARARLLQAIFFRGAFCPVTDEEKLRLFEEARDVGEEGLRRVGLANVKRKASELPAALRERPGGVALTLWTSVAWGNWALARGKLAAIRSGAAGRIRDLAQIVIDADPNHDEGGGLRVLGRLHDKCPRILFLTGWVSRAKGLECLRRCLEIGPRNLVTQFFLAEAILLHDEEHADEGRRLLRQCGSTPPRDEYRVEDSYYAKRCREQLARFAAD
jgi:hypothetical protein